MSKHETSPVVYAIVLNWNRPKDTIECISSLKNQTDIETIIVLVDNGSVDNSVEKIQKEYSDITIIQNSSNLGFAVGYNIGIKFALAKGADYIFIINNDAYIESSTILTLIKYLKDSSVGIVAPIIYYSVDPDVIWSAGGNKRSVLLEYTNNENGKWKNDRYPKILYRDFVTGCCFLAPRKTFEDIGLFDERFTMYYEDADFCYRVRKAKFNILVIPEASAWHKVSLSSGGKDSPVERYLMGKSSIYYFRKHASLWQWFFIIPFRVGSTIRTLIRLLMNKRYKSAHSYIRGLADGLK